MVGHCNRPGNRLFRMIVLTVILAVVGLAAFVVGLLSQVGKLPGNPVVGLRIPEVRKSHENWVMAHKIAAPAWMGSGAAMMAAAMTSARVAGWLWLILGLLVVASLFLWGLGSAVAAHTMAQVDAKRQKAEEAERAAEGCCSAGGAAGGAAGSAAACGPASAEACGSGQACGSCSLNGSCEGGGAAVDMDAARRAVTAQDEKA